MCFYFFLYTIKIIIKVAYIDKLFDFNYNVVFINRKNYFFNNKYN